MKWTCLRDPWELDNLALRPEQHYMLPIFRALSHATRSQLSKRKSQPPRTGHFNIDLSSAPLLALALSRRAHRIVHLAGGRIERIEAVAEAGVAAAQESA